MAFINRYSATLNGSLTFTGNTLGLSKLNNQNQPGTVHSIGAFTTLNTSSQVGTFPAGTTLNWQQNESQAILNLPAGSTVRYAELVWGGCYVTSNTNVTSSINNSVTLVTPVGSVAVSPDAATSNNLTPFYVRSANVTSIIQAAGAGTYSTRGVPATIDPLENTVNSAGWTLAVVYENPSQTVRNLNLFVGGNQISAGGATLDVSVSGFLTPAAGPVAGRVAISALEGDAVIVGDQLLFGPTANTLGNLSGPNNPLNNFFCSQINNDSGNLDTTGTFGTRNANAVTATNISAGRQGWDITNVDASARLVNNQTSAVARLTTSGDAYVFHTLGIQIDTQSANIISTKTVNRTNVTIGDILTYNITLTNNGQNNATNVVFSDQIPSGTTFIPGSLLVDGVPNAGNVTNGISLGTVPFCPTTGCTRIIQFQARVTGQPGTNPIPNASSTTYQYEPVPGTIVNRTSTSNTVITQFEVPRLNATKTVNQAYAEVGGQLTYTVVLANTGTLPLTNVVFTDLDPAGTTFVPGSVTVNGAPSTGNPNNGIPLSTINTGGTTTVVYRVAVTSVPVVNPTVNTATITYQYTVPGSSTASGSITTNGAQTTIQQVNVSAIKSTNQSVIALDNAITYTVQIRNTGTVPLTNVILTDALEGGTGVFVPNSLVVNGVPTGGNPTTGVNIGTIAPGASTTLSFSVSFSSLPTPNPVPNSATIQYQVTVNPNQPPDNRSITTNQTLVRVENPSLASTKNVDKAYAEVGDTLTYTINSTNNGSIPLSNVSFIDASPTGTSFIPGTLLINGVPSTLNPNTAISLPNLNVGGSFTIQYQARVNTRPTAGQISNTALTNYTYQLQAGGPVIQDSETTNVITTTIEVVSLSFIKSASADTEFVGDAITYTFQLINNGTVAATNVLFSDAIQAGTTFIPNSVTINGTPQPGINPTVGFSLGTIAVGATTTLSFDVVANEVPAINPVSNRGSINYNVVIDPTQPPLSRNQLSNITLVTVESAVLDSEKSVSSAYALLGDILTYTIVLQNTGTLDLTSVLFTDSDPPNTQFISGSVTVDGVPNPGNPNLGIPIGTLREGLSTTVQYQVRVVTTPRLDVPARTEVIVNSSFTTFQYIPNPGNPEVEGSSTSNPVSTLVERLNTSLTKTTSNTVTEVGDIITYTLLVSNQSALPLNNFILQDTLAQGTSFVPNSLVVSGTSIAGDPTVGVNIGTIPVDGTRTVRFAVSIDSLPTTNPIANQATASYEVTVDPNQPPRPQTLTSNQILVTVANPLLAMNKTVDLAFAEVGGTLTYTITLTNTGNVALTDIIFADLDPSGTTFVPGSVSINGTSSAENPNTGFPLASLSPGATTTIQYQVSVTSAPVSNPTLNVANASFEYLLNPNDPPLQGNAVSNPAATTVRYVNPSIIKSIDKTIATVGSIITYTIPIVNNGNTTLTNLTFIDQIRPGTTYIPGSLTLNGGTIAGDPSTGIRLSDLLPGEQINIAFKVSVDNVPTINPVPNEATINYDVTINPSQPQQARSTTSNATLVTIEQIQVTSIKEVDVSAAEIGDTLTYTVLLTNSSTLPIANVTTIDIDPSGTTFVPGSVTINGTSTPDNPNTGVNVGALAAGSSATIQYQVTLTSEPIGNVITNTAFTNYQYTLEAGNPSISGSISSNTVFTTLEEVDTIVIKTANRQTALIGEKITYTVQIQNIGTVDDENILLTDIIQNGTTFITGSVTVNGVSTTENPNTGILVGTVGQGTTAVVTYQVTANFVPPINPVTNQATINYEVTIDPQQPPVQETAVSNITNVTIQQAALTSVKTVTPTVAEIGDTLTYTVTLQNTGNILLSNLIFNDPDPNGTAFIPGSVTVNGVASSGNPDIGIPLQQLNPGGTIVVQYQATVISIPVQNPVTNIAVTNYEYIPSIGQPAVRGTSISNGAQTTIQQIDATLTKSVNVTFATIGDSITYTIQLTNNSTVPLLNAVLTDTIQSQTTYIPGSLTVNGVPNSNNPNTGIVLGTIEVGGTRIIVFNVNVNAIPTSNQITNQSSLNYDIVLDPAQPPISKQVTSNLTNILAGTTNLLSTKTVNSTFSEIGNTLVYTIALLNTGTLPLSNIVFTDTDPAGTTFIPGSATINGAPVGADPNAGINLADLAPSATTTVQYSVKVTSVPNSNPTTNTSVTTFEYVPGPGQPPIIGSSTSNPVQTTIQQVALTVTKASSVSNALIGDTITYTIQVVNNGTVDALNAILTDLIQSGTAFVPGSVTINASPSAADPNTGIPLNIIAAGEAVVVTFEATVNFVPATNNVRNQGILAYNVIIDPAQLPQPRSQATNVTVVALASVTLTSTKTVSESYALVGDTLTYTVVLANNGTITLTNLLFTDPDPAGTTFVPGSVTINGISDVGNPNSGLALPFLAPGGTVTVAYQVSTTDVPTVNPTTNIATTTFEYVLAQGQTPVQGTVTSNPVTTTIEREASTFTKEADLAVIEVGGTITYTLQIANTGTVGFLNSILTDLIASGTTFIQGSVTINGAPSLADPNAGIALGTIAGGSTTTVTFQVSADSVPPGGIVQNQGTLNYNVIIDPTQPPQTRSQTTNVTTVTIENVNLSSVKTVSAAFAEVGDTLTYTVVLTNTSNVALSNVIFTDPDPAGTTFVPGSVTINGAPNAGNPNTGISLSTLAPDGTVTVSYEVNVTSVPAINPTTNVATTTFQYVPGPGQPPITETSSSNPVITTILEERIAFTKVADVATIEVGGVITYTIQIINGGTTSFLNSVFTDLVQAGTTFVPGSVTINGAPSADNPTGITLGTLAPGSTTTITFQVTADSAPQGGIVQNQGVLNYDVVIDPAQPPQPRQQATNITNVTIENVNLSSVKTVSAAFAEVGDTITYTVVLANTSNVTLSNVVFGDPDPAGTAFVPGSVTINGTPSAGNPNTGVSLPPLAPGGVVTVAYQVTVTSVPVVNPTTNIATTTFEYIPGPGQPPVIGTSSSNPVTTTINDERITFTKSADVTTIGEGGVITYTLQVVNSGTVASLNTVLTDLVQAGTTFIPGSVTVNGAPNAGNPNTGIALGTLAAGSTTTVTFQVTAGTVPPGGVIQNQGVLNYDVIIDPTQPPQPRQQESNRTDVTVENINLSIVKTVNIAFAEIGDTLTYTVTLTNTSTFNLTNIIFTDLDPIGTTFVPGSVTINGAPSAGNPNTGIALSPLAPGGIVTVSYQVNVTSVPASNPTINIASTSFEYVPGPGQPPVQEISSSNPVTTTIVQERITFTKTANTATIGVGGVITYSVQVVNEGTVPFLNAVLTDIIEAGTTFIPNSVTINGASSTDNPNTGITLGTLAPGSTTTVIFQVTADSVPQGGVIQNQGTLNYNVVIDPTQPPQPRSSVTNVTNVTVENVTLSSVKSVSTAFAEVGNTLTYTVVLTNTSNVVVSNAIFTDPDPAGTTFVPGSVTINGTSSSGNPNNGINLAPVLPDGVVTIRYQVNVSSVPAINPTTNISITTFQYIPGPGQPPIQGTSSSNPVTTTIVQDQVTFTKAANATTIGEGGTITYTLQVINSGTGSLLNTVLTDLIQPGTTFVPGSVTINGTPNGSNPNSGIPLGALAPGSTITVTFQVTADFVTSGSVIQNQGTLNYNFIVDPTQPPQPREQSSNTTSVTVENVNLSSVKTVDQAFAEVGDTLTYTIVLTNTSTFTLTNVIFTDTDPAGTTFVPGSVTINGTPNAGNPNNGIPLAPLVSGGIVTVSYQVNVTSIPAVNPTTNVSTTTFQYVPGPGQQPIQETSASNPVTTTILQEQFTFTKVANPTTIEVGGVITYTLQVVNGGTVAFLNTVLTDLVQAGTTFIPGSVTINGNPKENNPNTGIPLGTLAPGSTTTVTFQVTANSVPFGGVVQNQGTLNYNVIIDPTQPPQPRERESNVTSVTIEAAILLSEKTVNTAFAEIGDTLTYTIVLTNTASVTLSNVVFTDPDPAGTTFIPGSVLINGAPNAGNPNTGIPLSPISPDGTTTISYQVSVTSVPAVNPTTNIAITTFQYVPGPGQPPVQGTSTSNPATTTIEREQITFTKSSNVTTIGEGGVITYTLQVVNSGTVASLNTVLTDLVQAGTAFVPGSVTINGTPSAGNPNTGISLGTIAPGNTTTVTFQVTANSVPPGGVIQNQGTLNYDVVIDPTQPPQPRSAQSTITNVTVENVNLSSVKTVSATNAEVGDTLTYTVVLRNTSTFTLNNVSFNDPDPAGTTFVPGSVTINGAPSAGNPNSGIALSPLAPGGSVTITYRVNVTSVPAANPTTNIATTTFQYVPGPGQPPVQETSSSNPVTTTILNEQLTFTKSVNASTVEVGGTINYTLQVVNSGTVALLNTVLTDNIQTGTTFVPGSVTINGAPSASNPNSGISLATLAPNSMTTVTFQAIANAVPLGGVVQNKGTLNYNVIIDPAQPPQPRSRETNVTNVTIKEVILVSNKTVNTASAEVGDTLRYTIVLTNTSGVTLNNVTFNDPDPEGTTFVPGSVRINGLSSVGNPNNGISLLPILPGGTVTIVYEVTVTSVPEADPITNISNTTFQYTASPGQPPLQGTSTSNPATTAVEQENVAFTKTTDVPVVAIDGVITYTLQIVNSGTVNLLTAVLTDVVQAGTTFVPGSVTINGAPSSVNPNTGITLGTLAQGSTTTVTFQATAESVPAGGVVNNQGRLNYSVVINPTQPPQPRETISNQTSVTIQQGILTASKTVSSGVATIGENLTYTVTLTNTGSAPVNSIVLTDVAPSGTIFVPGSVVVNGTPNTGNPALGLSVPSINPGQTATVSFQVNVASVPTTNPTENIATVRYLFSPNPQDPPIEVTTPTNVAITLIQPYTREQVINLLLASIGTEELSLAHILNAEGEKIQAAVAAYNNGQIRIAELLTTNNSVNSMLTDVANMEMVLQNKLEDIIELIERSR